VVRFHFSGAEVMFAAEQQLEAAQGVQDTPFVTMKLTINEQHEIIVEAFQVLWVLCFAFVLLWNSFCSLYGDCCEQTGFTSVATVPNYAPRWLCER
jgi:hypothetical protein